MFKLKLFALIGLTGWLALFSQPVLAYYSLGQPTGYVTDQAGLLNQQQKTELEQRLTDYEKTSSNEIAVVTINNLQGDTIENFAVKLFEEWQIGKTGKDNGVLLLVSKEERRMRIEVGYGLEGDLTDAQSFYIIDKVMKPFFRQDQYGEGILMATSLIQQALTQGWEVPTTKTSGSSQTKIDFGQLFFLVFFILPSWLIGILARSKSWWLGGVIGAIIGVVIWFFTAWLIGVVSILFLASLGSIFDYFISKNYHDRKAKGLNPAWWAGGHWGSGRSGFGGGFGGFGGGRSGGGGASGGW